MLMINKLNKYQVRNTSVNLRIAPELILALAQGVRFAITLLMT